MKKRLAQECGAWLADDELDAILDDFRKARLVYEEGEHIISLAFPVSFYERQAAEVEGTRQLEAVG